MSDGRAWVATWATELGVEAPSEAEVEQLLDLAGVAAHASERIAAPLACYLVGRAGLDPATASALAKRLAGEDA